MAGKLPVVSGREAVQGFARFGWQFARQSASHIILVKEGEFVTLSVPDHREVSRHFAKFDPVSRTDCRRICQQALNGK